MSVALSHAVAHAASMLSPPAIFLGPASDLICYRVLRGAGRSVSATVPGCAKWPDGVGFVYPPHECDVVGPPLHWFAPHLVRVPLGTDTKGSLMHPVRHAPVAASNDPPSAPPPMPAPTESQRSTKLPKPPKPRKVEKRRKGRKG